MDDKFPGMGTLELSNAQQWGRKVEGNLWPDVKCANVF